MADLDTRFPVYSRLLRLYPAFYRQRYSEQILQTLADMLDANPSRAHHANVWLRTSLDLPWSVATQRVNYASLLLTHETPDFVRRNSLVSGLLFVPFFVIATANDLAAHRFYHTWLWSYDVLLTWIIVLPMLGMTLSIVTLFIWLSGNRRSWWRSLCDLSHNWTMILPIVLGLGILFLVFFHDSVHCITGNPISELRNLHSTLRCIEQR
ncbi:MAG TPA: hypothetical protein VMB52_04115 [Verrucomicrobiae bacterium]|nr:hypothetical protein [Verrucomicrobiae bacterium]